MDKPLDEFLSERRVVTLQRRVILKRTNRYMNKGWTVTHEFKTVEAAEHQKNRDDMDAMPGVFEWRIATYTLNPRAID